MHALTYMPLLVRAWAWSASLFRRPWCSATRWLLAGPHHHL